MRVLSPGRISRAWYGEGRSEREAAWPRQAGDRDSKPRRRDQ